MSILKKYRNSKNKIEEVVVKGVTKYRVTGRLSLHSNYEKAKNQLNGMLNDS